MCCLYVQLQVTCHSGFPLECSIDCCQILVYLGVCWRFNVVLFGNRTPGTVLIACVTCGSSVDQMWVACIIRNSRLLARPWSTIFWWRLPAKGSFCTLVLFGEVKESCTSVTAHCSRPHSEKLVCLTNCPVNMAVYFRCVNTFICFHF